MIQSMTIIYDAPYNFQTSFQEPASETMLKLVSLHIHVVYVLAIVVGFVSWLLFRVVITYSNVPNIKRPERFFNDLNKSYIYNFTHGGTLEIIWTVLPTALLVTIAIPSFTTLYKMEEILDPFTTLKVIGHQWYWEYEYGNILQQDSFMLPEDKLKLGQLRLLEVDNRLILPIGITHKILVTGYDVIHSWALPSLGVKMDAVPGRLNQIALRFDRHSVIYGQCSEICGVNHGFMPIVLESSSN